MYIYIYLFIYFAHQVTILKRKKSNKNKIIEQSLMAWQHKDFGITPTNANSAPKPDPFGIDNKRQYYS